MCFLKKKLCCLLFISEIYARSLPDEDEPAQAAEQVPKEVNNNVVQGPVPFDFEDLAHPIDIEDLAHLIDIIDIEGQPVQEGELIPQPFLYEYWPLPVQEGWWPPEAIMEDELIPEEIAEELIGQPFIDGYWPEPVVDGLLPDPDYDNEAGSSIEVISEANSEGVQSMNEERLLNGFAESSDHDEASRSQSSSDISTLSEYSESSDVE